MTMMLIQITFNQPEKQFQNKRLTRRSEYPFHGRATLLLQQVSILGKFWLFANLTEKEKQQLFHLNLRNK